jgi:DNA-binding FrmR family transcriptional regulator
MGMKDIYTQKILRRLKIIEGQVRGLQRMIDEGVYCIEVITQSQAVKEALSGVENVVLEHHLATHVREQMRDGHEDKAIREIIKIYQSSHKK